MVLENRKIYLDHAATSPIADCVIDAMTYSMKYFWGNPSSRHQYGLEAKELLENARKNVADLIGSKPNEIYFTSGGTEADNLAILGICKNFTSNDHIITTSIEHSAVLECFNNLKAKGVNVTFLPVDGNGNINPNILEKNIRPNTRFVSIMHGNNEIGTIMPIKEIGAMLHKRNIIFHTDAVQTVGKIPVNVKDLNCDLLSFSSHKINGPKGVGALYIREGININPILFGGGQEKSIRPGTENMPGIIGFGEACRYTKENWVAQEKQAGEFIQALKKHLEIDIPNIKFNGEPVNRLPHNLHFSIPNIDGEVLILHLDLKGIKVSSGSACLSNKGGYSHVLKAINLPEEYTKCAIRVTAGLGNNLEQVDYVADVFKEKVNLLLKLNNL